MEKPKFRDINHLGWGYTSEKQVQKEKEEQKRLAQEDMEHSDAMEQTARKENFKAEMFDPKWFHFDPERAEQSPDSVIYGDKIILHVKTKDIVKGAGVDFVVADSAAKSSWLTERKLRARVKNDTVETQWVVDRNKNDSAEPDFKFSASYEGYSGNASIRSTPIPLERIKLLEFDLSE